jgi:thiol-disulfide isomerase/thioredoxin
MARRSISPALVVLITLPLLGIAAALLLIVASGGVNLGGSPPTPPPVTMPESRLIGRAAPNFELPTLYGGAQRLSSLRGRVVFINFWATWCEPCERELPAFAEFMAGQPRGGPIILAVNAGETADQIETFLADIAIGGIPILLDRDYRVNDAYDADFLPTTYVIDPAGVVQDRHVGEMTLAQLNEYVATYGAE